MTHGPREALEVDVAGWESKVLPATDMLDWHTGKILDVLHSGTSACFVPPLHTLQRAGCSLCCLRQGHLLLIFLIFDWPGDLLNRLLAITCLFAKSAFGGKRVFHLGKSEGNKRVSAAWEIVPSATCREEITRRLNPRFLGDYLVSLLCVVGWHPGL